MTDVVDKLLAKGEARGEAKGIVAAMKNIGKSMTEAVEMVSSLMKISKEEAEAKVKGLSIIQNAGLEDFVIAARMLEKPVEIT